jgi:hypothetical protein
MNFFNKNGNGTGKGYSHYELKDDNTFLDGDDVNFYGSFYLKDFIEDKFLEYQRLYRIFSRQNTTKVEFNPSNIQTYQR